MTLRLFFAALLLTYTALPGTVFAQSLVPEEVLQDSQTSEETIEDNQEEILLPDTRLTPEQIKPKKELPYSSTDEIPEEALADMQDFFEECQSDYIISSHYDCECRSARYLEERIKAGPLKSRAAVMQKISNECFNVPGAAGYAQARCEEYGSLTYEGNMSPEDYCKCVANNYAISLQRQEGLPLTHQMRGSTMTTSILRCKSNPTLNAMFPRLD